MQTTSVDIGGVEVGCREERALLRKFHVLSDSAVALSPEGEPLFLAAIFPWKDDAIYAFCPHTGHEALLHRPAYLSELLLFLPFVALRLSKGDTTLGPVSLEAWEDMVTGIDAPFVSSSINVEDDSASAIGFTLADSVLESDIGGVLSDEESDFEEEEPILSQPRNYLRDDDPLQSDKEDYCDASVDGADSD